MNWSIEIRISPKLCMVNFMFSTKMASECMPIASNVSEYVTCMKRETAGVVGRCCPSYLRQVIEYFNECVFADSFHIGELGSAVLQPFITPLKQSSVFEQ